MPGEKYLNLRHSASMIQSTATHVLHRSVAKLINRKIGGIETTQERLGRTFKHGTHEGLN